MFVAWNDLHEFRFRGKIFASVPSLTVLLVGRRYSFQKKPRKDWGKWTNPTVLSQLRWLALHNLDPQWLRIKLCACKLAILDLSNSKVTHKWEGWNQIKVATNLKVLNLSWCGELITTPDLSTHVKLERLILHKCSKLVQIHKSISRLKRLLFLDLSSCPRLHELPEEIGQLESLMELLLTCSGVCVLPESVVNIKSLKVLKAENLEENCAEGRSYLIEIPSEIGRLSSLVTLKVSGLSSAISQVPKLPESLIYLRLEFSEDIGEANEVPNLSNLVNLRELDLKLYYNREAPSLLWWIGRLSKLETLILTAYDIPRLSAENDLGSLSLLKTLHLVSCFKLQSLPRLPSSLLDICIDSCDVGGPLDISNLNRLLKFNVRNCDAITEIWGLPSSLAELGLSLCGSLKSIGDISNLKMLTTLSVYHCGVTEMRGLDCLENLQILHLRVIDALKRLPEDLSHLSQLKKLQLCHSPRLQGLPRLPCGLESLIIEHCQFANTCIDISNLKSLPKLVVKESTLREIRGLQHLENLQVLSLGRVSGLESLPLFPSNLKEFSLYDCEQLLCLPRLPQNLVKLEIARCPIQMLDVSDLTELKELRITMRPIKEIRRLHCLVNLSLFRFNGRVYWEPELEFLRRLLSGPPFYVTVTD